MKKNRLFLKTFLIAFTFSAIPYIATAQNTCQGSYPIASYLLDYAKELYERGDLENAKHEFSKLLVIDADNEEARGYLKKMGQDRGLYRSTGRLGLGEGSIYKENLSLRKQNEQSSAAITALKQEIVRKSARIKSLEDEIRGIACQAAESGNKIGVLESLLNAKDQAIADLRAGLESLKAEFEPRLFSLRSSLQDKELEAAGLRRELNFQEMDFDSRILQKDSEILQQEYASDKRLSEKEEELAARYAGIEGLNLKLEAAKNQLARLEKEKFDKEAWIEHLESQIKKLEETSSGQLAKYLQKLNGLEDSLKTKAKDAQDLNRELDSYKQQLAEQSSKMEGLNSKLKEYQDRVSVLGNSLAGKEQQMNELKTALESAKEELSRQLNAKEEKLSQDAAKIDELSKQLDEYNGQLAAGEQKLKEKDARIEDLNNQLGLAMEQLAQAEARRTETEAEIAQLEQKIKEGQSALEKQIAGYEDKLNKLKESMRARENELEDTAKRLRDLLRQKEGLEAEANQQILSLQATMDKLRQGLGSEINDYKAKLEMAERGIVVTVLTDIAFDSGKAEVLPEGKKILDKISAALKDISPDNHIVIEGHTDNVPIRYSGWKSNWELSAARALSALHHLIDAGALSPERFSVNGCGEYRPVADNDTESGKRQNRRVEIVIQPPKIIKVKSVEASPAEDNAGAGIRIPFSEAVSF